MVRKRGVVSYMSKAFCAFTNMLKKLNWNPSKDFLLHSKNSNFLKTRNYEGNVGVYSHVCMFGYMCYAKFQLSGCVLSWFFKFTWTWTSKFYSFYGISLQINRNPEFWCEKEIIHLALFVFEWPRKHTNRQIKFKIKKF